MEESAKANAKKAMTLDDGRNVDGDEGSNGPSRSWRGQFSAARRGKEKNARINGTVNKRINTYVA